MDNYKKILDKYSKYIIDNNVNNYEKIEKIINKIKKRSLYILNRYQKTKNYYLSFVFSILPLLKFSGFKNFS